MRIPRDNFAPAATLALIDVVLLFVATQDVMRAPEADRRLAVAPDVPIAVTSADFLAPRDPVLDRALRGL